MVTQNLTTQNDPKRLYVWIRYNLITMKIETNIQTWCPFNWINFKFRVHDFNMDGLDQPLIRAMTKVFLNQILPSFSFLLLKKTWNNEW
jgi:hypothetical protein